MTVLTCPLYALPLSTDGFEGVFCTRSERQHRLHTTFGFECTCAKCMLDGSALQESEARLESLADATILSDLVARSDMEVLISHGSARSADCRLRAPHPLLLTSPTYSCHGSARSADCGLRSPHPLLLTSPTYLSYLPLLPRVGQVGGGSV